VFKDASLSKNRRGIALAATSLISVLLLAGCSSNSDGSEPQPTKTVYVPVPESGINSGFQDELNSKEYLVAAVLNVGYIKHWYKRSFDW
jgi:hypothetical protein